MPFLVLLLLFSFSFLRLVLPALSSSHFPPLMFKETVCDLVELVRRLAGDVIRMKDVVSPCSRLQQYKEGGNFIKFYCSLRDVVQWLWFCEM
jgi:hypothetical protein